MNCHRQPIRSAAPISERLGALARANKSAQRAGAEKIAAGARRDPRIAAELRAALARGSGRSRWLSAWILSRIDGAFDLSAAPALSAALGARDADIRWSACALIVRLGNAYPEEVVPRLCAIAGGRGATARKMALYSLRDLGAQRARARRAAIGALADSDEGVRLAALSLLAQAGRGSAARIARCLASDSSVRVRRAAAAALGRFGRRTPRVLAALDSAAAQEHDLSLSRAAHGALSDLIRPGARRTRPRRPERS